MYGRILMLLQILLFHFLSSFQGVNTLMFWIWLMLWQLLYCHFFFITTGAKETFLQNFNEIFEWTLQKFSRKFFEGCFLDTTCIVIYVTYLNLETQNILLAISKGLNIIVAISLGSPFSSLDPHHIVIAPSKWITS